MNKKFIFKAEVWRWPGLGGWHFVSVPKKIGTEIKKRGRYYGAGFVRVQAKTGKTSWVTALFPHKESQSYLLSIKENVRKKEGIFEDDIIEISFKLIK